MTRSRSNRSSFALNRRRFLQASGLAAGSLFLPSRARAGSGPPQRLVIMYSQHGLIPEEWRMAPGGQPDNEDWEADISGLSNGDFGRIVRPLSSFKDRMLILDGLALVSAMTDQTFDEHARGHVHSLTGAPILPISADLAVGTSPSVDQLIAAHIRRDDRFPSLEYTIGFSGPTGVIYSPNQASVVPAQGDPSKAFDRLFPGSDPDEHPDVALVRERQGRLFGLLSDRYAALSPQLSRADQQKLEAHRDLISDMAARIDSINSAGCDVPERPDSQALDQLPQAEYYQANVDAFAHIATTALSCDLTRVVHMNLSVMPNDLVGAGPGDIHADYAHAINQSGSAREVMVEYGRVHAEHVRQFAELLDAIPEGGGSVLDNTLIVWCGELADGAHRFDPWPVVCIGGGAGWNMGRYVHWRQRTEISGGGPGGGTVGLPHNHFLVSLANAYGLGLDSVGQTSLPGANGNIDVTGGLDRLT